MRFITPTRPMRAGWTVSGGPINGLIAPPKGATSRVSGGVVTTSTARTDASMSPVMRHDVETCAGGGHPALGARTHGAVDRLFHRPAGHALHGDARFIA